jgi:hypothetical protein
VPVDTDLGFHALQELQGLLRLFGFVTLVILPENLVGLEINGHGFYRRRANIQADQKFRHVVMRLVRMLHLLDGWLRFERGDLNEGWTFVIVHHSSQKTQKVHENIRTIAKESFAIVLPVLCG